jgi:hypothetical protein
MSQSGESMTAFARRRGLRPQRLFWWKKQLAEPGRESSPHGVSAKAPALLPVVVRAAEQQALVSVELLGGVRLELRTLDPASARWVAQLAQALGGRL